MAAPTVSIIIATYNRSNVLRHTLESVRRNTFTDWECWVVGDCCSDDTAEVVAAFADPRLHFVNLSTRYGEQSGPNNAGLAYTSGRYLAWLNHDDLWLSDHLAQAVAELEHSGADLVFTPVMVLEPDGQRRLLAASHDGAYHPHLVVPASAWVLRRELVAEIGGWRMAHELYNMPSQEWIGRVAKAGKQMRMLALPTLMAAYSAKRPGCYRRRDEAEQAELLRRMAVEPDFRERELFAIACGLDQLEHGDRPWLLWVRLLRALFRRVSLLCGIHPHALRSALRYRRRGRMIEHFKKIRESE